MKVDLRKGDSLELLRTLADASVDSCVTDPPYGLSEHTRDEVIECLRCWLAGEPYQPKGKGFMGRSWDAWVPGPELWREVYRVLKPGGHVLAFAGTRSMDLMSMALRLAGFELRDAIGYAHDNGGAPLLAWVYGQGWNKTGYVKDEEGAPQPPFGTGLKPAWEPIILARRPVEGLVVENLRAHGTGALNIDACRIVANDSRYAANCSGDRGHAGTREDGEATSIKAGGGSAHAGGRWPANLIHDGSDAVVALFPANAGAHSGVKGTEPSAASTGAVTNVRARVACDTHGDAGSAARFFYCAKTSTRDRQEGLEHPGPQFKQGATFRDAENLRRKLKTAQCNVCGSKTKAAGQVKSGPSCGHDDFSWVEQDQRAPRGNTHPTVKPTSLMRYLVRLVTPPGGTVLDPFTGSGSTGKGCAYEGFDFIGFELDADDEGHVEIARARIAFARADAAGDELPEPAACRSAPPPEPVPTPPAPQMALFGT